MRVGPSGLLTEQGCAHRLDQLPAVPGFLKGGVFFRARLRISAVVIALILNSVAERANAGAKIEVLVPAHNEEDVPDSKFGEEQRSGVEEETLGRISRGNYARSSAGVRWCGFGYHLRATGRQQASQRRGARWHFRRTNLSLLFRHLDLAYSLLDRCALRYRRLDRLCDLRLRVHIEVQALLRHVLRRPRIQPVPERPARHRGRRLRQAYPGHRAGEASYPR